MHVNARAHGSWPSLIGIVGFFNSCAPDSAAVDVTTIENTTQQGASSWAAFLQGVDRRALQPVCARHTTHTRPTQ